MKFQKTILFAVFVLTFLGTVTFAQTTASCEQTLAKYVSDNYGVPEEDLSIYTSYATYPLTNRKICIAKIIDKETGEYYPQLGVDERGNVLVEAEIAQIEIQERLETSAKYGKMHPQLYDFLQNVGADEPVKITIWARCESPQLPPRPDPFLNVSQEELERILDAHDAEVRKILERTSRMCKQPVIDFIKSKGYDITSDKDTPLLYSTLPKSVVLALNEHENVDTIDLDVQAQSQAEALPIPQNQNIIIISVIILLLIIFFLWYRFYHKS